MSSPDQEQDTNSGQDINDLPADLRRQIAALVEHGSLPALRLVSRAWNEAANLAVRWLTGRPPQWPAEVLLIGQRWPNVEQLNMAITDALWSPDQGCRALILSLRPLMRLQHLRLGMGAALLPEGQEFLLRQTRLLGLHLWRSTFGSPGEASDRLLQVIGRLNHLTRLDCHLHEEALFIRPTPSQLEPATDEGMRCLSSLQSPQSGPETNSEPHSACCHRPGSLHKWEPAPPLPGRVAHAGRRPGPPDTPAATVTALEQLLASQPQITNISGSRQVNCAPPCLLAACL